MDPEKSFADGWNFACGWKRTGTVALFYFVALAVGFSLLAALLPSWILGFRPWYEGALPLLAFLLIAGLVYLSLLLILYDNARNFLARSETSLIKSFSSGNSRFFGFLGGTILVFVVTWLLGRIDILGKGLFTIVGVILGILWGFLAMFWVFFMVFKNERVLDSIKKSVLLVARKPWSTLATVILGGIFFIVSVIVLVIVFVGAIASSNAYGTYSPDLMQGANYIALIAGGAVALLIFAFAQVFQIGFLGSVFNDIEGGFASKTAANSVSPALVKRPAARKTSVARKRVR